MNTIKTAFVAVALLLLVTSTSFANNNPITSLSTSLRTELSKLVQNPELAENDIEEASIIIQFSVDDSGKIEVLQSQTDTPYLTRLIEKNVNGQQLDYGTYKPGIQYLVRFKFESK